MITEKQIQERAEMLQSGCHVMALTVLPKISATAKVQDVTFVWMFKEIAKLQLRVEELQSRVNALSNT